MSSSVNEKKAQEQAREAERLQKKADQAARQSKSSEAAREQFTALLKKQDAKEQKPDSKKAQDAERRGQEARGQKAQADQAGTARMARMARGGAMQQSRAMEQAKSFHTLLDRQRGETASAHEGMTSERLTAQSEAREASSERAKDVDEKGEVQREQVQEDLRTEAREQDRVNSAIDGQARGGGGGGGSHGGDGGAQGENAPGKVGETEKAGPSSYVRGAQKIPEAMLEKLVRDIYVGVNAEGLKMFQIELKEGVLQGGSIQVVADGGKISLNFGGLDGQAKNLVESSKGDLMRRLGAKGLTLENLTFA